MKGVQATYDRSGDLAVVYVYVRPQEERPNLVTHETDGTVLLDFNADTGELQGIELLVNTTSSERRS